jgi:magnesium-protoporphyrin O-methyltransferase
MECDGHCQGIEVKFDRQYVAKKLDKYRRNGPKKTTLALVEALQAQNVSGSTLLDIGGGVGDIQHALLQSGATSAVDVEASSAYIEACKAEAELQGHAQRIHHFQGDFVALAKEIEPADVVTLDRVVCCYPDANLVSPQPTNPRLLRLPRTNDGRIAIAICNLLLVAGSFRNFVHPNRAVETLVSERGLHLQSARAMGVWNVLVFSRHAG